MTQIRALPLVGQELTPFVRTTGLENWNRFAAVNDEFVPIHMDDDAGRAAGFPSAFGMGNLQWSYLHNLVRGWMGANDRIIRLECQFRTPNTKGMTVSARGVVRDLTHENGRTLAHLDIWTEDDAGNKLAPGSAVVEIPDQDLGGS